MYVLELKSWQTPTLVWILITIFYFQVIQYVQRHQLFMVRCDTFHILCTVGPNFILQFLVFVSGVITNQHQGFRVKQYYLI